MRWVIDRASIGLIMSRGAEDVSGAFFGHSSSQS